MRIVRTLKTEGIHMPDAVKIRKEVSALHQVVAEAKLKVTRVNTQAEEVRDDAKLWLNRYFEAVCEQLTAEATVIWASYGLAPEDGFLKHRLTYEAERMASFADFTNNQLGAIIEDHLGTMWTLSEFEVKVETIGPDDNINVAVRFEIDE